MLQLWQHLIEIGSGLLRRELLVGHMGDEKLQELLHAVIGELAVGIAPLLTDTSSGLFISPNFFPCNFSSSSSALKI